MIALMTLNVNKDVMAQNMAMQSQ